jgi:hypothetical protein
MNILYLPAMPAGYPDSRRTGAALALIFFSLSYMIGNAESNAFPQVRVEKIEEADNCINADYLL